MAEAIHDPDLRLVDEDLPQELQEIMLKISEITKGILGPETSEGLGVCSKFYELASCASDQDVIRNANKPLHNPDYVYKTSEMEAAEESLLKLRQVKDIYKQILNCDDVTEELLLNAAHPEKTDFSELNKILDSDITKIPPKDALAMMLAVVQQRRGKLEKEMISLMDTDTRKIYNEKDTDDTKCVKSKIQEISVLPPTYTAYDSFLNPMLAKQCNTTLTFEESKNVAKNLLQNFEFQKFGGDCILKISQETPYQKFLNILDHLDLKEKYINDVIGEELLKDTEFQSLLKSDRILQELKQRAKFIKSQIDLISITDALQKIKKSGGNNLMAHFTKDGLRGTFTTVPKLGQGSFGCVIPCLQSDGSVVAAKAILASDIKSQENTRNEIGILTHLDHPNIVKIWGYVQVSSKAVPVIILEYMQGGNLSSHLETFQQTSFNEMTDVEILHFTKLSLDVCKGMEYLHEQNCIHRDLKTDNILLDPNFTAKVGDFGISKFIDIRNGAYEEAENKYHSTYYTAKEALPPTCLFTKESDVWSYGVVVHQIWTLANERPYGNDMTLLEVKEAIRNGRNPLEYTKCELSSAEIMKLMKEIFVEIQERPSFDKIRKQLDAILDTPMFHGHEYEISSEKDFERQHILLAMGTGDLWNTFQLDQMKQKLQRKEAILHLMDKKIKFSKAKLIRAEAINTSSSK